MDAEKPTVKAMDPPVMPSHNPLPLSPSQQAQVRQVFYDRARRQCAEEIKAFAACAAGRMFSVTWACGPERRAMNFCMKSRETPQEHDAAREEWFSQRLERQRERERKAKVAAAQEEFVHDWWGLPENVKLGRDKGPARAEDRIGGMPAKNRPRRTDGGERTTPTMTPPPAASVNTSR